MKLYKKITGAVVAIALVLTSIFTVSAFKTKPVKDFSYWRYDLNQEAGALSGFNYTKIDNPSAPSCDDAEEIPCVIRVDENITTQNDLDDFLSNNYSSDDEVMALAVHTKSAL